MALNPEHQKKVLSRGFTEDQLAFLTGGSSPILQSLSAEEIQADWLDTFPTMDGNEGGALLLRFNDGTVSLKPDKPDWDEKKQRFSKYLYGKRKPGQPKGTNTQPWIPSKDPTIATEGLFDALVSTALMETPCAAATAPSHVRYSNFPESVQTYVSDADVPYHHYTGLLPVVIGQCKEKGLKLAHLPRNPHADYAYAADQIPDDCKWGMEEWCKEWKEQGLDPKQELQKVIRSAKPPFEYLRGIFLDYGKAGIRYPINTAVLTTGARAIADATDRPDQRTMLIDLLQDITKAPKSWIKKQVERRENARFQEQAEEHPTATADPSDLPQGPIEEVPLDPYCNADNRPIDVHLSNQLLSGDVAYGSSAGSLYSYDETVGFWSRIPQDEALRMVQSEIEQTYVEDTQGRRFYPYGSYAQVVSCTNSFTTKANNPRLGDPHPCIAFTDQTFNCRTGDPSPHSADNGITYGVQAPLLISENCPEEFNSAIATCFGLEALPVIRAWIRAIIDPTIPYGKFLLIIGNTGTGKGLLLEFLDKLLPSQCRSELLEPGDISGPDKVYQFILGKRYVSFEDLPHRLKQMQLFYKLVENAEVSARKLNASNTDTITPNCRFSAAATKMPTLSDGNDGLVRRAVVLKTKPRLGTPDRNLKAAIVGDAPAHIQLRAEVMGWALSMERQDVIDTLYGDACSDLLEANLDELEANADAVAHFVDECLVPSTAEVTPVMWSHMFDCFRAYCDKQGFNGKGSLFHFQGRIRGKLPHLHRPRRKEPMAEAKAAGRDRNRRLTLPSCDWGFELAVNAFTVTPMGHRVVPANFTHNGLFELRAHNPACPRDESAGTGLSQENTLGQEEGSGSQISVIAVGGTVSQGSSSIDREENKKDSLHAINTHAHINVTHIKGESTLNPETPGHTPEGPEWMV
ncbi:hypothetical protein ACLM45_12915 [Synechococcus sp. A10-1-5-9]|uniref:hypothetical protein n=1 Tax=Synechococcus sp. A10-1-5-9 TaxID=3392295 RepID=UPI0039EA630E